MFDSRLLLLPDDPLFGKIERARELLGELATEIEAWRAVQTRTLRRTRDNPLVDVWRIEHVHEPPIRVSILLGDLLNSARASLDHVAFSLARPNLTPWEQRRIYFPISRSRADFDSRGVKTTRRLLRPGGVHLIQSVQPFRRDRRWHSLGDPSRHFNPGMNPLVWLDELVKIDKHRYPHLAVGGVWAGGFGTAPGVEVARHEFHKGPVRLGDELMRVEYRSDPGEGVKGRPRLELFLDDPVIAAKALPIETTPLTGVARLIYGATREAIYNIKVSPVTPVQQPLQSPKT